MRLGELIHEYREAHDLSQRQFADMCKLSNGYVSMLERGVNPNTGKPITPTIPQLKKLADGMGTTIAEIIEKVDDMPIDITPATDEAKASGMSLNRFIIMLQLKHPLVFEAIKRICAPIEWASRAIAEPTDPNLVGDFPIAILLDEERQLLEKYRQLDSRGQAAVLNVLDHEYNALTGEKAHSSAKEA